MKNKRVRFTGKDSVLIVTMRQGKAGVNVAATVRTPGERTQTGAKSTHETEEAAQPVFEGLCESAIAGGWVVKTKSRAAKGFDAIPAPASSDPAKVAEVAAEKAAKAKAKAAKAKSAKK